MDSLIYLPVSLGEAMDKLTILDIKLDKIQDVRRNDVKNEYDLLYEKLSLFIEKYKNLYRQMKHINLLIWEMMDKLRDGKLDDHNYFIQCKRCVEYNDIRFRIKNKINDKSRSSLKEQKGYLINKIEININADVNTDLLLKPIKYLSLIKDLVVINSSKMDLKEYFEEDSNVIFTNNENAEWITVTKETNILEILDINITELNILII